jgi:hypothetical protein
MNWLFNRLIDGWVWIGEHLGKLPKSIVYNGPAHPKENEDDDE